MEPLQAFVAAPPAPIAALPPGSALTAVVQQVLVPGRLYRVDIRGLLLELEAELMLTVGARLPLKLKEAGPRGLVLTSAAPPPPAEAPATLPPPSSPEELVRAAALPARPEFIRAARALIEIGGRAEPETIQAVAQAVREAPRPDSSAPAARDVAAAYLVTRGLPATAPDVRRLAPAFDPGPLAPPPAPEALAPPPLALPDAPGDLPLARRLEQTAVRLHDAPEALRRTVAEAIARSPVLPLIDAALQELDAIAPPSVPPASAGPDPELEALTARILAAPTPDAVRLLLRGLTPPAAARLRPALAQAEQAEIARLPALRLLRQTLAPPEQAEPIDRAASLRILNALSALNGEGLTVLEVPVRPGPAGEPPTRALLVFRRAGRQAGGFEGFESFSVDLLLTRLGRVTGHVGLSRHTAGVRFRVRGRHEQRLLEAHRDELVRALGALGLEAVVTVSPRGEAAETPSLAEALRAQGIPFVDVVA
jgi:hypothetical protein